jgi:hypothetical protein
MEHRILDIKVDIAVPIEPRAMVGFEEPRP